MTHAHCHVLRVLLAGFLLAGGLTSHAFGEEPARADGGMISAGIRRGAAWFVDNPIDDGRVVAFHVRHPVYGLWYAAASLDFILFETESIPGVAGIDTAGENASSEGPGQMTVLIVSMGRDLRIGPEWFGPYIQIGVGMSIVDARNVQGVSVEGVPFTVVTDADDKPEMIPGVQIGSRIEWGSPWFMEIGLRYDYHIADWSVTDLASGRTGHIDEYTACNMFVGFGKSLW